ncbi:MAG: hypothetical protein ACMXYB_04630 [Candidatus Woesearchaeota archaeon]
MSVKKEFLINGRSIYIKPTPFEGRLSIEEYEQQLYSALRKIGVTQKHISISSQHSTTAIITWIINSKRFSFTCDIFQTFRENFGACTQAIKEDIRHILRGIKDINLVLKQYENKDNTNNDNLNSEILTQTKQQTLQNSMAYNIKDRKKKVENNALEKNSEILDKNIEILNDNDAKRIIQKIKHKYPQFSNFSYIPDYDRIKLEKAYYYLGKKTHWK